MEFSRTCEFKNKFRFVPSSGQQVASAIAASAAGAGSRRSFNPDLKEKEEDDSPGVAFSFCLVPSRVIPEFALESHCGTTSGS